MKINSSSDAKATVKEHRRLLANVHFHALLLAETRSKMFFQVNVSKLVPYLC